MDTQKIIQSFLVDSAEIKRSLSTDSGFLKLFADASSVLQARVADGGTVFSCGNGGSACDAMHLAEELTARYKRERDGIRAMHFLDAGALTCWSNDYDFAGAFERQVKTFCGASDVLFALSTSGNSENILRAARAAKELGTYVIGLTGKSGGKLKEIADSAFVVPSNETDRIQEVHITLIHAFCEVLEGE
ncbi:MAG: SIS domain-containing protein [Bdellovibrionales bacterium]|nr:SIS domain-containing protein [Bdellovibrionales bacterium]